jgi:hypothetical protein
MSKEANDVQVRPKGLRLEVTAYIENWKWQPPARTLQRFHRLQTSLKPNKPNERTRCINV